MRTELHHAEDVQGAAAEAKPAAAVHGADAWTPLLAAGLALVETIAAAARTSVGPGAGNGTNGERNAASSPLLESDPHTGCQGVRNAVGARSAAPPTTESSYSPRSNSRSRYPTCRTP